MSIKPIEPLDLEEFDQEENLGSPVVNDYMSLIKNVKVQLEVKVGGTHMTVGELMALKENSIVKLNSDIAQPLDIVLDGKVIARGHLAVSDDNFAIQITDVAQK